MMFSLIFVVIGVLSLILIVYLAKGHHSAGGNLDELASKLKFIDVNAFRNLIDEGEEEFLRMRLPGPEFRSIQRERKLAAIEYIWCAAENAAMLIRLGEAAKQDPDPAVSAAALSEFGASWCQPSSLFCRGYVRQDNAASGNARVFATFNTGNVESTLGVL
jgi:hypothetical protein